MKKLILVGALVCSASYAMNEKDQEWMKKEKEWLEIGKQHLELERETIKIERERLQAQQEANKLAELSAALEVMKLVGHHKHDDNNFGQHCSTCGADINYSQRVYPHRNDSDEKKRNISYIACSRCHTKDYEDNKLAALKEKAAVVILNHKFKSAPKAGAAQKEDVS